MRKISYRPVYNRKNKLNGQGTALLQVEAYLERNKIYFSTHIYLTPQQWDNKRKLIICHPNAEALNNMLREFIISLEQKEIRAWRNGQDITLGKLKEEFHVGTTLTFFSFIQEEIEMSPWKESTRTNRRTTLSLLQKFKTSLNFKDITSKFIFDFEQFLYANGCGMNTVAKHMKHLNMFVNKAIDKGYMDVDNHPFHRYRFKTKEKAHVFLLPEEVKRLEDLTISIKQKALAHTLDAFLFCIYTGLRYSDFRHLSSKSITKIAGKPWLVFHTIKTDAEVKLPIGLLFDGKAWCIWKKYGKKIDSFFQIKPNSCINKELIRIGRLAGIKKHFSFHTARHTNATLLLYKGVNITTVQKLLGHRNLATTQIYSEVLESTIVKDLKKCAKKQ